ELWLAALDAAGARRWEKLPPQAEWRAQTRTLGVSADGGVIDFGYEAMVKQVDSSCGAAALAILLTYHFGEATSEREILDTLLARLTKEEQRVKVRGGFSLLDLRAVAQLKGYQ